MRLGCRQVCSQVRGYVLEADPGLHTSLSDHGAAYASEVSLLCFQGLQCKLVKLEHNGPLPPCCHGCPNTLTFLLIAFWTVKNSQLHQAKAASEHKVAYLQTLVRMLQSDLPCKPR